MRSANMWNAACVSILFLSAGVYAQFPAPNEIAPRASLTRISSQPFYRHEWRKYMVDFMYDVASATEHHTLDTFGLAVQILDEYMSLRVMRKEQFMLFGMVSLWISSKAQTRHNHIKINDCVQLCGGLYTKDHFRKTELHLLDVIGWLASTETVFSTHRLPFNDDILLFLLISAHYDVNFVGTPRREISRHCVGLASDVQGGRSLWRHSNIYPHFVTFVTSNMDNEQLAGILSSTSRALLWTALGVRR